MWFGVARRISAAMRLFTALILPGLLLSFAAAQAVEPRGGHPPPRGASHGPAGPRKIGKFDDWTAATHAEGGQTVCYAFTRAQSSAPVVPGRGDVVLTVTQRPTGRDAVALSAGFAYPANAEAQLAVDKQELPLYTSARSAFAKDGHAVTVAFGSARTAAVRSPGPKGGMVTDTFSLRGFPAAYAAINKVCPVR